LAKSVAQQSAKAGSNFGMTALVIAIQ